MPDDDPDPSERDRPPASGGDDDGARGGASPTPPKDDPMGPPAEPCECWCMHCNRTFMSDRIWFQRVIGDPDGFEGFWMCPTPNCGGAGFTFDIFPTDPDHPANEGWHSFDEEGDAGEDADAEEDEDDEGAADGSEFLEPGADEAEADWDPDERKWKALDDEFGDADDDDDIEGEEWKEGLAPGERPPPRQPSFGSEDARAEWEAEQRGYDEPDRRPRELDWSDRPSRRRPTSDGDAGGEDDIPF
jgi:hypothetical protein